MIFENYLATVDPEYKTKIIDLSIDIKINDNFKAIESIISDLGSEYTRIVNVGKIANGLSRLVCFAQPMISVIYIELENGLVYKKPKKFLEHDILARECFWLKKLKGLGVAPEYYNRIEDVIVMSYVGEPVRSNSLPTNWKMQADQILKALKSVGCSHNDIKCDNLMVIDGKLSLLDFGWATEIGAKIPSEWPQGIGRQHRLGIHQFDDTSAINAALLSAEQNKIDRSIVMPN